MTAKVRALVDSGCNLTSFPKDWAATLGIDFEQDCVEASGTTAAGDDASQPKELRPRFYEPGVDVIFRGETLHLSALFRPGLPVILLGRDDFFSYFKISFDQRQLRFSLERYT